MKGVQSEGVLQENDKKILQNLYQNREGLRVTTIQKLTGLKTRTAYKRLNILKDKKLVENIFPIWKIVNGQVKYCAKLLDGDNIFELHNMSYVVKLIGVPDWWNQRKRYLMRLKEWDFKNINFGKGGTNPYQQLMNDNWVIQVYPESVIIIARKRYYSNDPYETIIQAINDFFDLWSWFEERMRFKFFREGIPQAFIRNNDINRIGDKLAEFCKKEESRFLVEIDKNRKVWVDFSEPFGKEANYPRGQEILERVTKDHLINKPMLNSELQLMVQQVTENQVMFDKNFQSHLEVINKLGKAVDELRNEIKNNKV